MLADCDVMVGAAYDTGAAYPTVGCRKPAWAATAKLRQRITHYKCKIKNTKNVGVLKKLTLKAMVVFDVLVGRVLMITTSTITLFIPQIHNCNKQEKNME